MGMAMVTAATAAMMVVGTATVVTDLLLLLLHLLLLPLKLLSQFLLLHLLLPLSLPQLPSLLRLLSQFLLRLLSQFLSQNQPHSLWQSLQPNRLKAHPASQMVICARLVILVELVCPRRAPMKRSPPTTQVSTVPPRSPSSRQRCPQF